WDGGLVVGLASHPFLVAVLPAAGIPLRALDLTRVPADGPVATWMASKPLQRLIGAVFLPERELTYALPCDPRENFDVLLFVESTAAARAEPWTPGTVPLAPMLVTETNEVPTNLGLAGGDAIPNGWHQTATGEYLVAVTDEASPRRGRTLRIAGTRPPFAEGALTQSFAAAPWRGRRLIFSAAMRAETGRIGTGAQLI